MPGGSEATEGGGRSTPGPSPVRLGALRHRDFRLFWIGQLISQVGTWMQSVAQAWLVLELTHSPLQLGIVSALQFTPILLLSPVGGALSDRFAKRRVLLVSQTVMQLQALVLAALVWSGYIRCWRSGPTGSRIRPGGSESGKEFSTRSPMPRRRRRWRSRSG